MNTKTLTKRKLVSAYGFACGYRQSQETPTMYKEICRVAGQYVVRSTINNVPELHTKFEGQNSHSFTIWESFDRIKDARKFYNKIK